MAQNIDLLGAQYPAVPSVLLPKVGGGTAAFTDVTDTTATAADVTAGTYFYTAAGVRTAGTGAGSDDPYPVRNDGKTHLWVVVDDMAQASVTLRYAVGTYATDMSSTRGFFIDWGDGSENPITKSNKNTMTHTYQAVGTYEVVIYGRGTHGKLELGSSALNVLNQNIGNGINFHAADRVDSPRVAAVETGNLSSTPNNAYYRLNRCSLHFLRNLEKVTIGGNTTKFALDTTGTDYDVGVFGQRATVSDATSGQSASKSVYIGTPTLRVFDLQGKTLDTNGCTFRDCPSLESVDLSAGYTGTTYDMLFYGCAALSSATLWDTMTFVSTSMFDGCNSLHAIDLPETVTTIGESGFHDCWSLQSITIPAAVTAIGANAFADCYSLMSITFLSTTPPTVADVNAWAYIARECVIHVPSGTLADYTAAANYPDPATYTYVED